MKWFLLSLGSVIALLLLMIWLLARRILHLLFSIDAREVSDEHE